MKHVGIWVGIIAIFVATTWGLISMVNGKPTASSQTSTPPPVSKDDQVLGTADVAKKVTLIEYADFQCPACKNYAPLVRQLKEDFGDDLLIVYRYFPLINSHKTAMAASQAGYAAGKQNKFWEMSDIIYENQEKWSESPKAKGLFTEYAKQLDLNLEQFASDYDAESTRKFILDQMNSGISIGVSYTPSFFLNGKLITNPQGYDAFKQLIQDEIKKNKFIDSAVRSGIALYTLQLKQRPLSF